MSLQQDKNSVVTDAGDVGSTKVMEKKRIDSSDYKNPKDYLQNFVNGFKWFWAVATDHRVNRKVYFMVALLFGAMGFHRFYARHYLSGILYLSFFFIGFLFYFVHRIGMIIIIPLELLALVQGIWVLLKSDGPDGMVEA